MIEESVRHAQTGNSLNQVVNAKLVEINTQVVNLGEVISEIANTSAAQADGVNQLTGAAGQMNSTTQSVASNAEESASAAVELASQAQTMQDLVGSFVITGSSRGGPSGRMSSKPGATAVTGARHTPAPRGPAKSAGSFASRPVAKGSKATAPAGARATAEALIPFDDSDDDGILSVF
jgi:methyl-accepting chemotaxis protein